MSASGVLAQLGGVLKPGPGSTASGRGPLAISIVVTQMRLMLFEVSLNASKPPSPSPSGPTLPLETKLGRWSALSWSPSWDDETHSLFPRAVEMGTVRTGLGPSLEFFNLFLPALIMIVGSLAFLNHGEQAADWGSGMFLLE